MAVRVGLGRQKTGSSLDWGRGVSADALYHPMAFLTCRACVPPNGLARHRFVTGDRDNETDVMFGLLFLKVVLKRTPHLRPGTVQEDPLIPLGNAEGAADFIRCPPLYVVQDDDLPLIGR